ncbi:MAG: kelch repeat-containing protein [Thermoplasmata archaeon]|nr:kelch repeat-containing protein [Thermoplasmata archaeon]
MTERRSVPPMHLRITGCLGAIFVLLCVVLIGGAVGAPTTGHSMKIGPSANPTRLHWHFDDTYHAPFARARTRMAYDAADNYTVLYGGYDAYPYPTFFTDTWMFKAGKWHQLSPTSNPTASTGLLLVYDPALRGVLAVGGQGPYGSADYNVTWLFNAGTWTSLSPPMSPPARSTYAMAYDNTTSERVLFGGYSGGANSRSDTW